MPYKTVPIHNFLKQSRSFTVTLKLLKVWPEQSSNSFIKCCDFIGGLLFGPELISFCSPPPAALISCFAPIHGFWAAKTWIHQKTLRNISTWESRMGHLSLVSWCKRIKLAWGPQTFKFWHVWPAYDDFESGLSGRFFVQTLFWRPRCRAGSIRPPEFGKVYEFHSGLIRQRLLDQWFWRS